MIGVIVTGHGNIATGIQSGMNLVFGNIENFSTIDFTEEITPEELEKKIEEKIEELDKGKGVLILTDIAGGTPFKTASLLSMKKNNVKVISGVNFPMLLEIICERENFELDSLYLHALEEGKKEIKGFEFKKKQEIPEEDDSGDGI